MAAELLIRVFGPLIPTLITVLVLSIIGHPASVGIFFLIWLVWILLCNGFWYLLEDGDFNWLN